MAENNYHDYIIIIAIAIIVIIQLRIWIRSRVLIRNYTKAFQNIYFNTSKAYIPLSDITNDSVKNLSDIAYREPWEDTIDVVEM